MKRLRHPNPVPITVDLPLEYELRMPQRGTPEALALLIHGFGETGKTIFTKLEGIFPENHAVLALNGPFPVPKWKGDYYVAAYSWYFFDPNNHTYLIDMAPATRLVTRAIEDLKLQPVPKTVIGFSQGGFFASHLAQNLIRVERVIGIGCRFLEEELPERIPFRMDQVFGADDKVVPPERAVHSHQALRNRGMAGEFRLLPGVAHEINEPVREALKELIGLK